MNVGLLNTAIDTTNMGQREFLDTPCTNYSDRPACDSYDGDARDGSLCPRPQGSVEQANESRLVSSISGNSGCEDQEKGACEPSVPILRLPWEPCGRYIDDFSHFDVCYRADAVFVLGWGTVREVCDDTASRYMCMVSPGAYRVLRYGSRKLIGPGVLHYGNLNFGFEVYCNKDV